MYLSNYLPRQCNDKLCIIQMYLSTKSISIDNPKIVRKKERFHLFVHDSQSLNMQDKEKISCIW